MLPLREEEATKRAWVCRQGLQGQKIKNDNESVTRPGAEQGRDCGSS